MCCSAGIERIDNVCVVELNRPPLTPMDWMQQRVRPPGRRARDKTKCKVVDVNALLVGLDNSLQRYMCRG